MKFDHQSFSGSVGRCTGDRTVASSRFTSSVMRSAVAQLVGGWIRDRRVASSRLNAGGVPSAVAQLVGSGLRIEGLLGQDMLPIIYSQT